MASIQYKHSYPDGLLTIDKVQIEPSDTKEPNCIRDCTQIKLKFVAIESGAQYERTCVLKELCEKCAILGEPAELAETLAIKPECKVVAEPNDSGFYKVSVTFTVAGRKKQYPVNLMLDLKVYPEDQQELAKLSLKNVVLHRKIADLEKSLSLYREAPIAEAYERFIKIVPVKCDRENFDYMNTAMNFASDHYDQWLRYKLVDPNHGIGPFLIKLFRRYDSFYPYGCDWDFSDAMVCRLKLMITYGLDVTQLIHDPETRSNAPPSISCIGFVKRTIDERQATFDKYYSDPEHKSKIDAHPINFAAILVRMRAGYQVLVDSVRA